MRWVHVTGRNRCSECGDLVLAAWLYFPTPTTWTLAYCETCVATLTETEER